MPQFSEKQRYGIVLHSGSQRSVAPKLARGHKAVRLWLG
jgi:hypothetical protein